MHARSNPHTAGELSVLLRAYRESAATLLRKAAPAALFAVALLIGGRASAAARTESSPGALDPGAPTLEVLDRRAAEGQQCIVCRVRVHEGDIVEVLYKGRTFFVSAKMLEEFEARPDRYFYLLQAHGSLFDEAAMETPPMRSGWLVFGLYVLVGLVGGAACSYLALERGLAAWGWFFAGLALNVVALAAILTRKGRAAPLSELVSRGLTKIPSTHPPATCDRCGAATHPAAAACADCGHALQPTVEPETARA